MEEETLFQEEKKTIFCPTFQSSDTKWNGQEQVMKTV